MLRATIFLQRSNAQFIKHHDIKNKYGRFKDFLFYFLHVRKKRLKQIQIRLYPRVLAEVAIAKVYKLKRNNVTPSNVLKMEIVR